MRISGFAEGKFYYPDRVDYGTPADDGLAYEPVTFKSLDGTRLTGWFLPARGRPKGTVVHAHGNAANISNHATLAAFLPKASYHVLVFDYRGYGESEGSPGRRGCLDDVRAAVDYARSRKEVDGDRIALFGQSLGGALSIVAAAERPGSVRAVVAEAAFTSHRAIARDVMQRNPITWLFAWPLAALALSCDYAPIDAVDQIAPTPLLVVHGTADEVIPYWMGEALYARAKEPKRFYAVPGGRHLQISEGPRKAYHNAVLAFLDETVGGATAEPGKAAEGPR
jgi:alpha-beta hydrolase superfamily lysophospholipase